MPIPTYGCVEPEICCDILWNAAEAILEYVVAEMVDCLQEPTSCGGGPIAPFVSLGPPSTDLVDYLAVWWSQVAVRSTSQDPRGNAFPVMFSEVQWHAQLVESNYPTPTSEGFPTAEELHAASRVVYSHGERLYRTMAGLRGNVQMVGCSDFKFLQMVPVLGGRESIGGGAGVRVTIGASSIDGL